MAEKEKKKRVRKEYTEAAAATADNQNASVSGQQTAGDWLRAVREEKGLTLENVASSIHLRVSQIRAIEEGDINHLPGMAYAVGFVRSYANFLKMNSADVVARFKTDHGGITKIKTELNFPEPMNEGKTPSPMIVGVATICVVVLLSFWAIFSGGEKTEDVADVAAETVVVMEQPIDTLPVETLSADAVVTTGEATDTTAAVAQADPAAVPAVADAPAAAAAAVSVPVPAVSETAPVVAAAPVVPKNETPAAETIAAAVTEEPIIIKAPQSRIVLQAEQTSWVQVTDAKGTILLKKVMKPGERFFVPDQKGLTLVTSNAGGIAINVDGKRTEELGREGDIVRGVALDPESLKARRKSRIRNY